MSVAVVTGAGGSLGRAIAGRLAADGHAVAVSDVDAVTVEATRAAVAAGVERRSSVFAGRQDEPRRPGDDD